MTGFHKRKLQKKEAAKKKAQEREKQERLETRREVRPSNSPIVGFVLTDVPYVSLPAS